MTRKRLVGRVAALALFFAVAALALGPSIAERALTRYADELGAQVELTLAPLALRADIASFEFERAGFRIECNNGSAEITRQSLFRGTRALRSVTFERCSLSQLSPATNQTSDDSQQPEGTDSDRIATAFGALASLPDVRYFAIDDLDLSADLLAVSLSVHGASIHDGNVSVHAAGSLNRPLSVDLQVNAEIGPEAARVVLGGVFASHGVTITDPILGVRPDGTLSCHGVNVSSAIGRFTATSLARSADGSSFFLTGAVVALAAEANPARARAIFDRSIILRPSLADGDEFGPAHQAISYVPFATRLMDRVRFSLSEVPVRIEAADLTVRGVPLCDSIVLDDLLLDRDTLIGSGRCDDSSASVVITPDEFAGSLTGFPVARLLPGGIGLFDARVIPTREPDGVSADLELTLHGVGATHEAVAVDPVALNATADLTLVLPADPNRSTSGVAFSGTVGEVPIDGTLDAEPEGDGWTLRADGGVSDPTPCATMWEAVPSALTPSLQSANVTFSGSAAPRLRATYTVGEPGSFDMRRDGFMGDCVVESIDAPFDPTPLLADDYIHTVTEHVSAPVQVGPGTWGYATMDELPAYIPALMHLSEEIAFFDNPGFSMMLMRRAVRMNLRESRYVYGGSTVSQQLAKNLFFGREKTLARKFEEAIVVWAMERIVPKERILELYLNCVEFAPDVYGITAAARHYFDKRPGQLTPLEAAFLAALKPAPSRGERHRARGHSPDTGWWHERLLVLLQRLVEYGPYIDQAEVDYYAPYIVAFPTSEHASEVGVEPRPRPKWAVNESFTEARARLNPEP